MKTPASFLAGNFRAEVTGEWKSAGLKRACNRIFAINAMKILGLHALEVLASFLLISS